MATAVVSTCKGVAQQPLRRRRSLVVALLLLLIGPLGGAPPVQAQEAATVLHSSSHGLSTVDYNLSTVEGRAHLIVDEMAAFGRSLDLAGFRESEYFDGGKYGGYIAMAMFERREDLEKARRFAAQQLVGGGVTFRDAMFREFLTMALFTAYRDRYGKALRQKVKKNQLSYGPINEEGEIRCCSENHRLMWAASGYAGGLTWPESYPQAWFEMSREYLLGWFEEVTRISFWEQDSPTYLAHHLGPILLAWEVAPDGSEVKMRAKMVLEWYFAGLAGEYLKGYWITTGSRDKGPLFGLRLSAESTALMWMYFGDAPFTPNPDITQRLRHWKVAVHFAVSDYELPAIFRKIATDRDRPFEHREVSLGNPMNMRESSHLAPGYGVAAIVGGDNGRIPPNTTRWKLTWIAETPDQEPTTFLMNHPDPDQQEGWKGWVGASPHERALQHGGDLVIVYDIPVSDVHPFIDGPYNASAYKATARRGHWWFFHAGKVLFGVWADKGLHLTDERRQTFYQRRFLGGGTGGEVGVLRSDGRKNALVVETASPDRFAARSPAATLDAFAEAVISKTVVDSSKVDTASPALEYVSLEGDTLAIEHGTSGRVNGSALDLKNWPLLSNPWMHQEVRGQRLCLRHGALRRVYDFEAWAVCEGEPGCEGRSREEFD